MSTGERPGTTRSLLKRLRHTMRAASSAQKRLDETVGIIAGEMVAEVCSIYLRRAGDVLELFATRGLRPEAVHLTRLRVGEGLVGEVAATARPLALADAQAHPRFAYRPETGEEIYHSLLGVPLLRDGRVLGVLVVQNRTRRRYTEVEIEALETVAMVLAELVAAGSLVSPTELRSDAVVALDTERHEGVRLNGGIAIGRALLHRPRIVITRIVAEDTGHELDRLARAVSEMQASLDHLVDSASLPSAGEHREILDAYRMFAEDRGWLRRIGEAIRSGLTAEAAVTRVLDETRARMSAAPTAYLRERFLDLEDLNLRLLQHLAGTDGAEVTPPRLAEGDPIVLIARSMGPAELLDYPHGRLRGLVLEEGSPTAHVAVVARALDLPVVGRVRDALRRADAGDVVVVDADAAAVYLRPPDDILERYQQAVAQRGARRRRHAALIGRPAVTRDGIAISLMTNAGLAIDAETMHAVGAEGIGLFRTEIALMGRDRHPTLDEERTLYRSVLKAARGRPVTFRTFDIGGDKTVPYFTFEPDENPALGWRALRISLDRPRMLRQQLRAMLLAASDAGTSLSVMFPMVSSVTEFGAARRLVAEEAGRLAAGDRPALSVGAMLEVPALLWQLEGIARAADFLSVGSNDLLQFLFAADRSSPVLGERYDPLSPPVLRLLKDVVTVCERAGTPLTLCGEMAGQPIDSMVLIGLGLRRLSMSPFAIGPVKEMLLSLDTGPLAALLSAAAERPDGALRNLLRGFARDRQVII